jgi:hypothetical protein
MRSFFSIIGAPVICAGVLSLIFWENSHHAKPADAEPFHMAAKARIEAWPTQVGSWRGRSIELPEAAIQLLKPNAHVCYQYYDTENDQNPPVTFLVVQCGRASDMSGHYPPNCYKSSGHAMRSQTVRTWMIPGEEKPIEGMEYRFDGQSILDPQMIVYNFFILPGKGVVSGMEEVREASGNFERRHFGAAQVQVLFTDSPHTDQAWRDEVFARMVGSNPGVIKALSVASR